MNSQMRFIAGILFAFIVILMYRPSSSLAAGFENMSSITAPKYYLYNGAMGMVGGPVSGSTSNVISSNMNPYRQSSDLGYWYGNAQGHLQAGKEFRNNNLTMVGVFANSSTAKGKMLTDPKLNYESAGLLAGLQSIIDNLISARNNFAYNVSIGYPSIALGAAYDNPYESQQRLQDTVKTIANIYLMIADEFLIDALEFRFSAAAIGIDQKLEEQIGLLEKAQSYYEKAVDSFVYGFSPAVGTTIYASDYFDDTVFSLFNLSIERLSLCLREKSSKMLVREMVPDSAQNWSAARTAALESIRNINTTAYIMAAATASKQGENFGDNGGHSLAAALDAVRKQGNIYNNNLNPLGYDNRYIPMNDYADLYNLANGWLLYAQDAETNLAAETRAFDANEDALRSERNSLDSHYISSLSSFTGCSYPDPDIPAEVQDFLKCTGEAGGDLYDCRLADGTAAFEACVAAKTTKGTLSMKYRNIMEAQTRLEQALLNRQNIQASISYEEERTGKVAAIKLSELNERTVSLDYYLGRLEKACTISHSETTTSLREKPPGGKWTKNTKKKDNSTTVQCKVNDETLQLTTEQEKDMLATISKYEIQLIALDSADRIKNLLLQEAVAVTQIQDAAQQKNSAIEDFENSYQEKETQWFLYNRGLDQLKYFAEPDKYATLRILKSQAAITLSDALNYTSHYAYLAAKAMEYKYLKPIVDEPVAGGRLRLTDLFKAQTSADLQKFLTSLNSLNTQSCPWGTFDPQYNTISLAYHILGLTDGYLDPDGDGLVDGRTVAEERKARVQKFIRDHMINGTTGPLTFTFGLSEENSFLGSSGLYNMKIWNGAISSPCDQLVSDVKGVSATVITTQTSSIRPKVRLKQSGHSSLRNEDGDIAEYIPVSEYHNLFEARGDFIPSKEAEIIASINVDPRYQTSTGTWSGAFKGRGITSSAWEMTIFDWNAIYPKTDFSKITDIRINIDTIGECCY